MKDNPVLYHFQVPGGGIDTKRETPYPILNKTRGGWHRHSSLPLYYLGYWTQKATKQLLEKKSGRAGQDFLIVHS